MKFLDRLFKRRTTPPKKEPESALIRELDSFALLLASISIGDDVYTPTMLKEYTDRMEFSMIKSSICSWNESDFQFTLPVGSRFVPVHPFGSNYLFWDCVDCRLRVRPDFDKSQLTSVLMTSDGKEAFSERFPLWAQKDTVLAVGKAFAEEHLTEACRDYAFQTDENAYYWSMVDASHQLVLAELDEDFIHTPSPQDVFERLGVIESRFPSYSELRGKILYEAYRRTFNLDEYGFSKQD